MILKGRQRSSVKQLVDNLLKTEDNEHVEVHELRGFLSEELPSAFNEIHAVSKGTRAKQPFFSLSFSPSQNERVPFEVFETAIEQIEQKLGLEDQPRVVCIPRTRRSPPGIVDHKDWNPLNFCRENGNTPAAWGQTL